MQQIRCKVYSSFCMFVGMIAVSLLWSCCNPIVDVPEEEIPSIELYSGYSVQLTASSEVQWGSDNPSVATISATGLVTAVGAGDTTIFTYSSNKQHKVCTVVVFPKRNILFYIATDADAGIDGDVPGKINQIRAGWKPQQGEMFIYADRWGQGAVLMHILNTKNGEYYDVDTIDNNYGVENSADANVFNRVIQKVTTTYPADSYGMIFFSHASGWLPEGALNSPRSLVIDNGGGTRKEMTYVDFAAAIPNNKFDFIIFEACLMADVAVMYELRNKTKYVLVSSAEIVAPGFEYIYRENVMGLFNTAQPVDIVLKGFADAYCTTGNSWSSFTISIVKMSEMAALAAATKTALKGNELSEENLSITEIQTFDRPGELISSGSRRSRYFDLGHTVENLTSASDYAAFNSQMGKTVIWKRASGSFLPAQSGFYIRHHCGLTTYIKQGVFPVLNTAYENASWYKAIY